MLAATAGRIRPETAINKTESNELNLANLHLIATPKSNYPMFGKIDRE